VLEIEHLVFRQGCQIFLFKTDWNWKYLLNYCKIDQLTIKYTELPYNFPNGFENINIIHSKALQNIPKLGCLLWKYTIWHPCVHITYCHLSMIHMYLFWNNSFFLRINSTYVHRNVYRYVYVHMICTVNWLNWFFIHQPAVTYNIQISVRPKRAKLLKFTPRFRPKFW
jgi:hypothetical protein